MKHLLEILKIVNGAVNADRSKVASYTEQLAVKLESEGDGRSAAKLRRALLHGKMNQLSPARATSNTPMPVDSESRMTLADEEVFERGRTVDVFLEPGVSATVEEFLSYVSAADRLIEQGVGISPSLLAVGPPGCGKTQLGRHIAARLSLPLLTARTDSLISSFLGSTAKNLRLLFEHAMARPCVLFLDEFDAVAKLRDDKHELGELKRVVVSLLQNIDALDGRTILLAATNHEHLLDPAIWRRFAYRVRVARPTLEARTRLYEKFIGEFGSNKDIALFAAASQGLTGAEIRQIAEDSKRSAIIAGRQQVDEGDVVRRIVKSRAPEHFGNGVDLAESVRGLRALDEKLFTYRRLAEVFDVSVGHISNLIKKGD